MKLPLSPGRLLCLILFINNPLILLPSNGQSIEQDQTIQNLNPEDYSVIQEEFNYVIEDLGEAWVKMDSKIISPDANSAFRSKYRNTVFLVIPEKVGVEFDISAKQLADVVKLNLSSGVPDAKFSEFREIEIDGLTWIRFNALAQIAGHSLAYSYAVLSHNGFQYQLIYWKESYLLNSAELELEDLLSKFHLIDADKIQSSDKFHSVSGFKDSTTGFSIDLGDLEWMNWPNHEVDIPQAKFSASYKNKVFLFATPVFHQELKPTIKSLKAAVLEQVFGLEPTVIANTKDRLIRRGDDRTLRSLFTFPGVALDIVNHAILEFWSGKNISYCIGGFSTDSSLLPRLEEALDRSSFLPPEALELAYEELRPEEIFFQSQVLNSIAISLYAQNNFSGAKQYLDLSLNFSKEDPIILSNYGSICVSLEKFDDLLKLYESSPDAFDEFYAFREWHALALSRVNRKGEAEEEFNEMLETGNLSETGLWSFLELLSADSRWEDGIEICGSYIDLTGSQNARQWRAGLFRNKGDYDMALLELNSLKDEKPFELEIDYEIALTYLESSNFSKTIEYINAIEEDIDQFPFFHTLKGNAFLGLQSYVKAKASFEKAVELNPLDEEAKSLLEYATLALGKGDTQVNKNAIEAVPMSHKASDLIRAVEAGEHVNDHTEVVYSLRAIHFKQSEEFKYSRHFKVRIVDDQGVDSYSTLSFGFDPFGEEIYVNEICVRDEAGNLISSEVRDDFYIMHNEQNGMVSQDKVLYAPVQGLSKGCTLEYTVTYNRLGIIEEIPFSVEYLSFFQPAKLAAISFSGDSSSLVYSISEGVESCKTDDEFCWYVRDAEAYKQEAYQAKIESFVPIVAISDGRTDWKTLSTEYLEEIGDRLAPEPEVSKLATYVVSSLETDEEKTRAIYNYIQAGFTYKALEFGPRANIPNKVSQIIQNKYGDCKDLALLAFHMLQSLGISSHLALVNTERNLIKSLPSMDQFDHMILYLPDYDEGRFVDCTSRHASLDLSTPPGLTDRDILVLDQKIPRILNSGTHLSSENQIYSEKKVLIEGDNLTVEETLTFQGVPSADFRFYLGTLHGEELLSSLQSLISATTGTHAQLQDVKHSKNPDPNSPLTVTFKYVVPKAIKSIDGNIVISEIPTIWEKYYLKVPYVKDRITPFSVRFPFQFSSVVSLNYSSSFHVAAKDLSNLKVENDFHQFTIETKLDARNRTLVRESKVTLNRNEHPPVRFHEFQESAHELLSAMANSVTLESF